MANSQVIHIACPAMGKIVRGKCDLNQARQIAELPDEPIDLRGVSCSQDSGKCGEILCALHRYNRKGTGTWFPDRILVAKSQPKVKTESSNRADDDSSTFSTQA